MSDYDEEAFLGHSGTQDATHDILLLPLARELRECLYQSQQRDRGSMSSHEYALHRQRLRDRCIKALADAYVLLGERVTD